MNLPIHPDRFDAGTISEWVRDARARTIALVEDLTDDQVRVPYLPIINPFLWEIGHAAWFQEHWVLQRAGGREPMADDFHRLYDSINVEHTTRWNLDLPSRAQIMRYLEDVRDATLDVVARGMTPEETYFVLLSVFHEDMHDEAFTYTRQTLSYAAPSFAGTEDDVEGESTGADEIGADVECVERDVRVPGRAWRLGSERDEPFVFDNEKWAHDIEAGAYGIARAAVTEGEFEAFVEDDGYTRQELWCDEGWAWRQSEGVDRPLYWRKDSGRWWRRRFDAWAPIEPHVAMIHVNWYEADAFCRWANRRLPTELEWEIAASANVANEADAAGSAKRRYTWGDELPATTPANLDWRAGGTVDVRRHAGGDSPLGCRQMIGNVWEWTSTPFHGFPGFSADPYEAYSEPWFHTHRVLRGGAWTTRSRLARIGYRNFYKPDRRDVLVGFRTCALEA